jgi:hypothetical protein
LRLLFLGSGPKGQSQRQKQGGVQGKAQLSGHRNILVDGLKLESLLPMASAGAMKCSCAKAFGSRFLSGLTVMAGPVPAIPFGRARASRSDIIGTRPVMT